MVKNFKKSMGFSVVELVIVLAVAAILLGTAVPSFKETIQNNRLATQVNELHAGLSMARSEAVKRNNNVTICPRAVSEGGTLVCDSSGNWGNGWIVFVDDDADGEIEGGEIVRVGDAMVNEITASFSEDEVIYASSGLAISGTNGTFTLCDTRGADVARGLVVGPSGRPRLPIGSDDDFSCS